MPHRAAAAVACWQRAGQGPALYWSPCEATGVASGAIIRKRCLIPRPHSLSLGRCILRQHRLPAVVLLQVPPQLQGRRGMCRVVEPRVCESPACCRTSRVRFPRTHAAPAPAAPICLKSASPQSHTMRCAVPSPPLQACPAPPARGRTAAACPPRSGWRPPRSCEGWVAGWGSTVCASMVCPWRRSG